MSPRANPPLPATPFALLLVEGGDEDADRVGGVAEQGGLRNVGDPVELALRVVVDVEGDAVGRDERFADSSAVLALA